MSSIKNIIFDLGGVLLNIDYDKTTTAFKNLGYTDFEKMYSLFKANNVFDNLETGHITEPAFYEYMLEAAVADITESQVTEAWNAMLLDFRIESLSFLKQLGQNRNLFLLSNTNSIHKKAFEKKLKSQTGLDSLDHYFTKAYFSHQVGLRKPNEDIFRFVLQDAGIIPSETLFIDDLIKNIETANNLGFITQQLMPGEKIEELKYD
jgi:putative hydrolase of the HAD superfamily